MNLISGSLGSIGLIAGLLIVGSSAQLTRTIPANAEAVIARTGIVPIAAQSNQIGMVIGAAVSIGGLAAIGYSMLVEEPIAIAVQRSRQVRQTAVIPASVKPATPSVLDSASAIPAGIAEELEVNGAVKIDLIKSMMDLTQFCHVLVAGENGTGKTTLVMELLRRVIVKFGKAPEFDLLIIDPKLSRWGGLCDSPNYQSAFPSDRRDLIESVDRLEAFYGRLKQRAKARQGEGILSETPILAVIDEINTYLDSLQQLDQKMIEENRNVKPADREPFLGLHSRARSAILGIGRMGRQDKVWLWLSGQNPNLSALGFDGASDRANFTVVAVGCDDNQIGIDLALSNSKMFPTGSRLRPLLEAHQGNPYQIAVCSRYPKNLLIMPTDYQSVMSGNLPQSILDRFKCKSVEDDPWGAVDNVVAFSR